MSTAALWNVNLEDLDPQEATREVSAFRLHKPHGEGRHGSTQEEGSGPQTSASEFQLAKAIGAIERRTRKSKRRADEASAPFNRILETTEFHRGHETIAHLAHRVSDMETRLIDRFVSNDENPVRAALARLETKLETFGRQHSLAEAVALQHTFAHQPKTPQSDSLQRLEDKLDAILSAVRTRSSESSAIAFAASQKSVRRADRRLGEAIDEIAQRQQILDIEDAEPRAYRQLGAGRIGRPIPSSRQITRDDTAPLAAIRSEIADLAAKVDGLSRGVSTQPEQAPQFDFELDLLRADIARMSRGVQAFAAAGSSNAFEAVDKLFKRVEISPDLLCDEASRHVLVSALDDARATLAEIDNPRLVERLDSRLVRIGDKIDDLDKKRVDLSLIASIRRQAKDARNLIASAESKPLATENLIRLVDQISALLDAQINSEADLAAPTGELRDLLASSVSASSFAQIETALEALEEEFDRAVGATVSIGPASRDSSRTNGEIEELVRDLSRKMDAVQSPGADHETLNALQEQIAILSSRFDNADDGLVKLNALQRSMQDVFAHLEQTRASVETSAAEAAREVLRIAAQEGQAQRDGAPEPGLAKIQEMQDEAEERTRSALSAVQQTLTKVVDRLSSMEVEVAEARTPRKPEAPAKTALAALGAISLGTPSSMFDQDRPVEKVKAPTPAPAPAPVAIAAVAETQGGKADFIAAARRAAKTVQVSLPAQDAKRSPAPQAEAVSRTLLLEESRDYIARHKKPVLLGLAALFVIIGTLSVAHRVGQNRVEAQRIAAAPKMQVAEAIKPAGPQGSAAGASAITPSPRDVSARNATVKTDVARPITSALLPVFATRPPTPPAQPSIPAKLKAMANAGDAGAQYVLGTQYAEGRGVSRDFKAAAGLYQKAAAKGIAPAQYRLAALYEKGLGVEKDKTKARSLYLQAAEAGNPRAMHNLAVLLADGDGKPDYEGAATWFRKAAQFGMEDSQYNLAILLARGLGVQQSLVQSYQWFAIAAAQDDPEAAKKRDEVATKLGIADLAVAKALAASFKPRPATVAATAVQPPPGGWDGAIAASPLNSARQKISSL